MQQTKRCVRCDRTFPSAAFWKNRSTRDGLNNWCAECTKAYARRYRPRWVLLSQGLREPERALVWKQGLARLKEFVAREGHARVPLTHREGDFELGRWVRGRRSDRRRGRLATNRAKALETLPGWSWRPQDDDFEGGLERLKRYAHREGHALVPNSHREDGFRLGAWVSARRADYRLGRLAAHRIAALEAVPGWMWDPGRTGAPLKRAVAALRRFAAREGHARVPPRHREGRVALGTWVHERRREWKEDRLDPGLAEQLARLPGWAWDPDADAFLRVLEVLRGYASRHGHARLRANHIEGGFPLGAWAALKRRDYRKRRLPSYQVEALAALPGWSWRGFAPRPRRH